MGIGAAMCRRFSLEGAAGVVVADIDTAAACQVAAQVDGIAVTADVSKESDVQALVARTVERFGRVDIFCSNAGIFGEHGGVEVPDPVWHRVWEINVLGHLYAARAALPHMLARRDGYLIQTISAAGLLNQIRGAPYAVSKHAAIGLAEFLAIEYGDRGIGVSCVCPQGVQTRMLLEDAAAPAFLLSTSVSADYVAECVIRGIEEERFLILPHPEVEQYRQRKVADYDRWLRGMRRLRESIYSGSR
jgi:NAD(P)-dependent dehydrogenase (short-subunit alcohol dehydrogenase family)